MKINVRDRRNQQNFGANVPSLKTHGLVTNNSDSVELLSFHNKQQTEALLRASVEEKASVGDYSMAIALLDRLIELYPNSAIDYNNRGLMYFRNGQLSEAIADYNLAIEINPKLDSAYNNRANYYVAIGELAAAIADYDLALDLNPANIRAWINQGITFRELGLYELAIEDFDIALIISRQLQGRIFAERGRTNHLRGDWNCANADYHRALTQLSAETGSRSYLNKVNQWLNELLNPINV
jgi:tetratricopeptide (TPR) repeat protein